MSPGSPAALPTLCAPSRTALLLMPTLGLPRAPEGRGCPTRLCPQQRGGFAEHPASGTLEVPGRSGAALCLQHQLPLRGSPGRQVLASVTPDGRQGARCGAGVHRSPGGCGSPDRLRLGDPGGLPSRGPFAFQPLGPGAGSSPALGTIMSTGGGGHAPRTRVRSGEKPPRGWKELLFGECGDHGPETRRGSRAATETLSADLGRHPPEFPELRAPRGSPGSRRSSIQFSHPAPTRGVRRQQQGPCRGRAGDLLREAVPGPPAGRQGRARDRRLQTRRGAARGYGPVDGYLGCRGQEQLSRGAQHLN